MFSIRPFDFSDTDYETLHAINSAVYPEYQSTVEQWHHRDRCRDKTVMYQRVMMQQNGEVIAVGEFGQSQWSFHPDKYFMHLLVHPDCEAQEPRYVFYEWVMTQLKDRNPLSITDGMLSDRTAYLTFLEGMGFTEMMRTEFSELDLKAFDAAPYAGLLEDVRQQGIRIRSLADLQKEDPEWLAKLSEMEIAISRDVPSPDPPRSWTLEEYELREIKRPDFSAEGWFVALDGDRYVGMSHLHLDLNDPGILHGSLTGVLREYRRRGIATVLKLHMIAFAQQCGGRVLLAANESNNPMYQINLRLGFTPKPGWVSYEKTLRQETPAQA